MCTFLLAAIPSLLLARVHLLFTQRWQHFLAHQFDAAHRVLVAHVAVVLPQEQMADAGQGTHIAQLLDHLVRRADHQLVVLLGFCIG